MRRQLIEAPSDALRQALAIHLFQQAAKDFAQLSRTKLTMPVLAIGGEKANGALLGLQMKIVASNETMVVLKNTGHWVLEERPREEVAETLGVTPATFDVLLGPVLLRGLPRLRATDTDHAGE